MSLRSPHSATGRCSSSRTDRRFGQTRRSMAWRTHGTDSKACCACRRSSVKKVPARRGMAWARIVASLLRDTSPWTSMVRMANTGWRTAQCSAAAASARPSSV